MDDLPRIPIGDCKNTLSFPGDETSLDSGLPLHLPMEDIPCPHGALHTVFSTTQWELSKKHCGPRHQAFGDASNPVKVKFSL